MCLISKCASESQLFYPPNYQKSSTLPLSIVPAPALLFQPTSGSAIETAHSSFGCARPKRRSGTGSRADAPVALGLSSHVLDINKDFPSYLCSSGPTNTATILQHKSKGTNWSSLGSSHGAQRHDTLEIRQMSSEG